MNFKTPFAFNPQSGFAFENHTAHRKATELNRQDQKEFNTPVQLDFSVSKRSAKQIGVLSAKGGSGASTLALNLSLALSCLGQKTTLIDANLQQPDLVVYLGKQAEHSMLEFFARSKNYDETVFQACSLPLQKTAKAADCSLLSGHAGGEDSTEFDLSELAAASAALVPHNDCLVFDLPKNLDRHLVTLMDRLDCIALVFEPTLVSVAAARRWLKIFSELSYPRSKYMLVLNRAGARVKHIERDLPELIAASLQRLPNAYQLMEDCSNCGQPAIQKNPRDKYSIAVMEIAKSLTKAGRS